MAGVLGERSFSGNLWECYFVEGLFAFEVSKIGGGYFWVEDSSPAVFDDEPGSMRNPGIL